MNRGDGGADDRAQRPDAPTTGRRDGLGGLALAGLGLQFAIALVAASYLGQWLDRRLGTAPVFLLGCIFVGAGASFYAMVQQLNAAQRPEDDARREGRTGRPEPRP